MFERFTDRARKVMALANQEGHRLNHEYVGTEHILLGLVKEGVGVGATVLKNLDIDLRKVRQEVEKLVKSADHMVTVGKLPLTPRAQKVIEYAIQEARSLGHVFVGTEHLLLGLLREKDGVAAQVLMNLGLMKFEEIRSEVIRLLGTRATENQAAGAPVNPHPGSTSMFERFTDRARKVMALANQEAHRCNHPYIDTEHILLGFAKEGSGVGAMVLKNLGIESREVSLEVENLVKSGPVTGTMGRLPMTPHSKKAIQYAIEESRDLGHNYVGTEHLLLGLLRETEGIAAVVLTNLGLTLEVARERVRELVKEGKSGRDVALLAEGFSELGKVAPHMTQILLKAAVEARAFACGDPEAAHFLLALLTMEDPLVTQAFAKLGVKPEDLRAELVKLLQKPL